MPYRLFFLLSVLSLGMWHCSTVTPTACHVVSPNLHQVQLNALTQWQWSGSMVVPDPKGGKRRLSVLWRQEGSHYHIVFSDYFGMVSVVLDGGPSGVDVKSTGQPDQHRKSVDQLIRSSVHVSIPLRDLVAWLKGQVNVSVGLQRDTQGLPSQLNIADCQINWSHYQCVSGVWLPGSLTLKNKTGAVHITFDRWEI